MNKNRKKGRLLNLLLSLTAKINALETDLEEAKAQIASLEIKQDLQEWEAKRK